MFGRPVHRLEALSRHGEARDFPAERGLEFEIALDLGAVVFAHVRDDPRVEVGQLRLELAVLRAADVDQTAGRRTVGDELLAVVTRHGA